MAKLKTDLPIRAGGSFDKYTLAILATSILWGTFWIPLRQLDQLGHGSIVYTGLALLLPFLALLPRLVRSRQRILAAGLWIWLLGIAFGVAGSFYAEGALRGNVARVILLFYLTPVWSTLLARIFLKEPITGRRIITLILGLLGMWIILGADRTIPLPKYLYEWLGLTAGIAWGVAMVAAQRVKHLPALETSGVALLFFTLSFALLSLIPGGRSWAFDPAWLTVSAVLWTLALAFVWNLPGAALTLYGAVKIEPGKVAILLMMEVVIGIATSAWLTDEPFGLREGIGALLIIAAGITEFVPLRFTERNKRPT